MNPSQTSVESAQRQFDAYQAQVEQQVALIETLACSGHDTEIAERVLLTMQNWLALLRHNAARLGADASRAPWLID